MKTFRKALSVMLCLCMIMSAMAVGLNVFAQEKSEAVERFEANVKAFTGDVGKVEPSAEDLEAYEKPVAEYKALGNSDKESVDVMVFDVFYHHVVMRERQISVKNHPEISSSKKDHYINAADAFVVLFGYLHSELTSESNAAAIKTAVKALDMNFAQRIAVSFIVSIALSSSADGALRTLVLMIPIVKVGVKIASWFGAFKK